MRLVCWAWLGLLGCAEGLNGPSGGASEGGGAAGGENGGAPAGGQGGSGGDEPGCGDGAVAAPEECEPDVAITATCESEGFAGGEISCDPETCTLDKSLCLETFCGNDLIEEGEVCDGTDLGAASCVASSFAGGTIACDASCALDTSGCKPNFNEGFETLATLSPTFVTTGNPWGFDIVTAHSGNRSMHSSVISHNQSSSVTLTLTYETAGTISFWHMESTETCCDKLEFLIDGVQQNEWSSSVWSQASFNVAAGTHTLQWRYSKDVSINSGLDTVWVDDIVATNGYLP